MDTPTLLTLKQVNIGPLANEYLIFSFQSRVAPLTQAISVGVSEHIWSFMLDP